MRQCGSLPGSREAVAHGFSPRHMHVEGAVVDLFFTVVVALVVVVMMECRRRSGVDVCVSSGLFRFKPPAGDGVALSLPPEPETPTRQPYHPAAHVIPFFDHPIPPNQSEPSCVTYPMISSVSDGLPNFQ